MGLPVSTQQRAHLWLSSIHGFHQSFFPSQPSSWLWTPWGKQGGSTYSHTSSFLSPHGLCGQGSSGQLESSLFLLMVLELCCSHLKEATSQLGSATHVPCTDTRVLPQYPPPPTSTPLAIGTHSTILYAPMLLVPIST